MRLCRSCVSTCRRLYYTFVLWSGPNNPPLIFPTHFKSDFDINEGGYTALSKASGAFQFNGFKW